MLHWTKGYVLLTMLVLTGLGGRFHSGTITGKDRRALVNEIKNSSSSFLSSIEGLSPSQLRFHAGRGALSIQDCILDLASKQKCAWSASLQAVGQEMNGTGALVADWQLSELAASEPTVLPFAENRTQPDVRTALQEIEITTQNMLKLARTTTDNLRARCLETCLGRLDAWQTSMLLAIYTEQCTARIRLIRSAPNFPG
jgi:hypothetical protein